MIALIIGAAGFVGKHLIKHLQENSDWTIFVTKLSHEHLDVKDIEIVDLDILDYTSVQDLLTNLNPDYIFHLAAQSSVSIAWNQPALTVDINIKGVINLLEAVRHSAGQPRVLLIGSGEEYGYVSPEDIPIKEETPLRPGNIYAGTKVAQGIMGQVYAKAYGLEIIIVRAFNHIGPGQSDTFVLPNFCKQIAMIETGLIPPVIKVGNLEAQRDFADVQDIVRAYRLLAEKGESGAIYNVGSGKAISIAELLNKLLSLTKADISIEKDPSRMRPSDVPLIKANISKLSAQTGWKPEVQIEQTLSNILNEWRTAIKQGYF